MKPGVSLQTTGIFFILSARSQAVLVVSSEVCLPRTTSTSFMRAGGLKKCIPTTDSGVFVSDAIALIERDEVFDVRIASGA